MVSVLPVLSPLTFTLPHSADQPQSVFEGVDIPAVGLSKTDMLQIFQNVGEQLQHDRREIVMLSRTIFAQMYSLVPVEQMVARSHYVGLGLHEGPHVTADVDSNLVEVEEDADFPDLV